MWEFLKKYKNQIDLWGSFLVLLIPNIAMWIIFFPGYFQADHQATIAGIINGHPSEWHSLVWGYLFYIGVLIFHSYDFAGFVQSLLFAIFILFGIYNLKKYQIVKWCLPFSIVMALLPTFLMYNQLYASDIIFAYSLFTLTCLLACYAKLALQNRGPKQKRRAECQQPKEKWNIKLKNIKHKSLIIKICIFIVICCLMRKNAIVIPLFLAFVMLVLYRRKATIIVTCSLLSLIISIGIFAVLDAAVGAEKSPSQEILSVPSVQIAASYKYGYVDEESSEIFEQVRSKDEWVKNYDEYSADPTKANLSLTPEFIKAWFKTGLNNTKIYIKAYGKLLFRFVDFGSDGLLKANNQTNGSEIDFSNYDDITLGSIVQDNDLAIDYAMHFGDAHSIMWQKFACIYHDFVSSPLGFVAFLGRYILFNRGLPFWIMFIGAIIALRRKFFKKFLVIIAPCFAIFLSLIFFAPIALFRYSVTMYYASFAIIVVTAALCRKRHKSKLDKIYKTDSPN